MHIASTLCSHDQEPRQAPQRRAETRAPPGAKSSGAPTPVPGSTPLPVRALVGGDHLSDATCPTHAFFISGE